MTSKLQFNFEVTFIPIFVGMLLLKNFVDGI